MPQLPSGLRVGLDTGNALYAIKEGDFRLLMAFNQHVKLAADISSLVTLVYFGGEENGVPTDPELSGFNLHDFHANKCGWSDADNAFFKSWLDTPQSQRWMDQRYQELVTVAESAKSKLPEILHGILD